ncbi:uncharacterized protein LOC127861448 [Dreissena polymorpha]|uniref:Uncharacterized protein n=1 Tax=Dreissena polymorpha TaxID=45954 RepID=A0A9D3YA40_DREPO|nr:uncharacterized protein LOC127861448 [Dreissena polymorpha]KAH3696603.1 hypothetical protein DPMN_084079 [Dreissena polymorpha]
MSNGVLHSKQTTQTNGGANGAFYFGFQGESVTGCGNGSSGKMYQDSSSRTSYQNGFIRNKEYGDFDTIPSPTKADGVPSSIPAQMARQTSRSSTRPTERFIPEREIEIPKDGSLHEFSADDMSTFLRHMGVEERIVTHVHSKGLDGRKFSKFKDSDLERLSMKNPIICHFRDKSIREKGGKKKIPFLL